MTKEVTKKENTEVVAGGMDDFSMFQSDSAEKISGLEVIDASDIRMPKLKLMQTNSPESQKSKGKITPGQYYNTVSKEAEDEIDCIFLCLEKTMVKFKTPFKRGEAPLCKSYDAISKAEGDGDGACKTCQYSSLNPDAWEKAKADGKTKTDCNMSYVWIGIDAKTKTPFRIIMSGSAVSETKDFINQLVKLNISPYKAIVTLKSEQRENEQGVFYVPVYKNLRPNTHLLDESGKPDPAKIAEMEDNLNVYRNLFKTDIVAKDVVDVDGGSEVDTENGALF